MALNDVGAEHDAGPASPRWFARAVAAAPAAAVTAGSVLPTALAHASENAAYGLLAFAPLGVAFGPVAMALALLGSVIANLIASTVGAGRLVSGQRASLSLLQSGMVASVAAILAGRGDTSPASVLSVAALAVVGAGLVQAGFGWLRLGRIVKYTPYPVRAGVTSGVGLLLIVTTLPVATGHAFGSSWRTAFESPHPGAILVALCALSVTAVAGRFFARIPPVLPGLAAAIGLRFALAHGALADTWLGLRLGEPLSTRLGTELGPLIGTPSLAGWPAFAFDPALLLRADMPHAALLIVVVGYAFTAAVLCSLDTLLAVSIVDGRLRHVRDADRELRGQGAANVVTGLVTGQAFSPSIVRSLNLALPHPRRRHVVVVYALAMLFWLAVAPDLVGLIPTSALGGTLVLAGFRMVAPAFWRAPLELWRRRGARSDDGPATGHRTRGGDWAIELVVACSAVVFGLGESVLIGAAIAVLLFVRANMRDVVRAEWTGRTRRSLKARPAAATDTLARDGARIALLELGGPLFFGTADGLRERLRPLEAMVDTAILDLHQITEIDVTAARILVETAEDWDRAGRRLVFAEWARADVRRQAMEDAATDSSRGALHFADHTDLALEEAEERLLRRTHLDGLPGQSLELGETMLGRDLDPVELATLSARLDTLRFERGTILFRTGDPGDGLYVSLKGDIGLRSPGSARRLASFAPGVVIGEMAMLARGTRSAEAVAESDVIAMKLSSDAFDRLMAEEPALAAKLLKTMSLHLADRVRTLTGDLSHWVSRAAAGHGGSS